MRIRRRYLEGRKRGLRAIPEEGNDGVLEQDIMRRKPCQVRQGQGKHRKLVLCLEMEDAAAGHQHLEMGTRSQEFLDLWSSGGYLLEVVQDQQQVLLMQVDVDALEQWLMVGCLEVESVSDGRNDETRVVNGSQGGESHAISEIGEELRRHLYGKARLADATHANEGQQADIRAAEQGTHAGSIPFAPNEWGEWEREVARRYVLSMWRLVRLG